jgi:hypothetical protein
MAMANARIFGDRVDCFIGSLSVGDDCFVWSLEQVVEALDV